ncbi:hypothetical protein EVG20_g8849 [Dentipellis fragilis]|uniref:Uncharacterized protein n=1 Tax=Dentipellis fragilis TaxID=205917 RepID=A0A4Y9Y759_9AGAM|nr:hypothetical protein EVG20_g8849 [Dentipellis fragilis]
MSLSVSSFPEPIYVPPSDPELDPSSQHVPQAKRRNMFSGLFSGSGSGVFSVSRRRRAVTHPLVPAAVDGARPPMEEEEYPVLAICPEEDYVGTMLERPDLRIDSSLQPSSPKVVQPEVLAFPPTPTADAEIPNSMKESIRALRLSRIHRPIDCGRKPEDEALPPWAARGVIASFGTPAGDTSKDGDKEDSSTATTPTSAWSALTRFSRPSAGSGVDSRTSSMYWPGSSATSAASPSSSKSKMPAILSRSRTGSDASISSKPVRPVSITSQKSTKTTTSTKTSASAKTTASSPAQLTGTEAMRLRSLSTSSDKTKGKSRPPMIIIPPKKSSGHHRSRTLSNSSEKNKSAIKPPAIPTEPMPMPSNPSRSRSSSISSEKAKGKARASPSPKPTEPATRKHPPVPPLPISSGLTPSSSKNDLRQAAISGYPTSSRTPSASQSAVYNYPMPQPPKSAPSIPQRKGSDPSRFDAPLPSAPALLIMPVHSPVPISPPAPPLFIRHPSTDTAPTKRRELPPIPTSASSKPVTGPPSSSQGEWEAMDVMSAGISMPSVWGPPGSSAWDAAYHLDRHAGRSPSRSPAPSTARSETIVVTKGGSDVREEKVEDVIDKLRGMKMK